jgi:signal transduction histidine kinase
LANGWALLRRHPDPFVAAVLTGLAAIFIAAAGQLESFPGNVCVLGFCALIGLRQWRPLPVALVAGILIALPEFAHDAAPVNNNGSFISLWAAIFLFSYALGSGLRPVPAVIGATVIVVGVTISGGPWNPVPVMVAVGPLLGGQMVASRRRASEQLELRARELEEEREVFARESVRYERARIARELHDIVAHSVSLMVVQANAGERLAALDPQSAAEAFASISDAARQAEDEIALLVELLNEAGPASPSAGLRIVEELVRRAQASGLAISCQLSGDIDTLAEQEADTAYRLVQEGITNAMKHAPGAAMEISVSGRPHEVEISVVNGPAMTGSSGLERSGGAIGLAGMRQRVAECGGTFSAGATDDGGWKVRAFLPCRTTRSAGQPPPPVPQSMAHTEGS